MHDIRRGLACALAVALGAAGPAAAQIVEPDDGQPEPPVPPQPALQLAIATGYQYLFRSDLDNQGSYAINRAGVELKLSYPIDREFQIEGNLRTLYNGYRFRDAFGLDPVSGEPWTDVTTLDLDFRVRWWMTNDLALVFGPYLGWSRESGASWGQAVTGGGFVGLLWRASPTLAFGGGVGVTTRLEDDALVYPLLFLDWAINEHASLTSVAGPVGRAFTGLEFVWKFDGGFEVGTGFRYEYRRFRLDDSGFAPNGVGEETGFPIWARLSYVFSPNARVDLYGGFSTAEQFKVDDSNGDRLRDEDGNIAPTLAIALRFTF